MNSNTTLRSLTRKAVLLLSLSWCLGLSAQNYHLQFSARSFLPQANFEDILDQQAPLSGSRSEFQGTLYKLIQFRRIPTEAEKLALRGQGVELLHYVRNYAWLSTLPGSMDPARLSPFPIRFISDIDRDCKLSRALFLQDYPSHALSGPDHIRLNLHLFQSVQLSGAETGIRKAGAEILCQNSSFKVLEVRVPIARIPDLAALPFVYHISEVEAPPVLEREIERTINRSNVIAADYAGGLHFDGTGVTAAVSEGMVDTTLIDFQGRIFAGHHTGSSFSGHANGVGSRLGGAGNFDPGDRGMAFGAELLTVNSGVWNNSSLYFTDSLRIANHSYGYGCSFGYNSASVTIDNQVRTFPSMMHVFSCGNIGTDSACNYYGAPGWANITGAVKQSKNVIATGAVNAYDERMNFSSKGPAYDGRIKPDLCAMGPGGTSFASPGVAGTMVQLYQAYKFHNGGQEPDAGLIKGILQNTADDLGNPGPDFQYGYGRINARRAYAAIAAGHFLVDSIANGAVNTHALAIPPGTRELRCMVYWTDFEASAGAAAALVNDLDFSLSDPNALVFEPWVLDTAANASSLDLPAVRGRDSLNNMEQITIANPLPGTYALAVEGRLVPMGPQKYYLVYKFLGDELQLTHPAGGESWAPGENEVIRWDAYGGNGPFDLEFSADSGATWSILASNVPASQRYHDFLVPDTISGQCLVRLSRGGLSALSAAPFSIIPVPDGLDILWSCGDSALLSWNPVAGATGYEVSRLGAKYMDLAGTATQAHLLLSGLSTTDPEWLSVKALGPLQARGRRAIALQKMPGDTNCNPVEAELMAVLSPVPGYYPDCITAGALPVSIRLRNNGLNALSGIPLAWQVGAGPVHNANFPATLNAGDSHDFTFPDSMDLSAAGVYQIKVWIALAGDANLQNDTLAYAIEVYPSGTTGPFYTQDFDAFATCSTAWGCADISCPLSQNWFNVPNNPAVNGDSIDFRTNTGGTGTGGTGPSGDHTSGNGNYLYLETSGDGGSGCRNKQAELHSPCFDLRGTNQPELSFWYHLYGSSIGSLHVDAFVEGRWDLDIMPEIAGAQGNAWLPATVDLGANEGKVIFLRFRATTGSGFTGDLAIDDINLNTLPRPAFSADQQVICMGDTVQFTDLSTFSNTYHWQISPAGFSFAGGTNAASQDPQVVFNNPGLYTVTLTGTNSFGSDSLVETAFVNVSSQLALSPASDSSLCPLIAFSGASQGLPGFWQWDFGDGAGSSNVENPTYDYSNAGNGSYTVTLIAGNACGEDTATLVVEVNCLVGGSPALEGALRIYPNPAQDQLWIDFGMQAATSMQVGVFDVSGRRVLARHWEQEAIEARMALDIGGLPMGLYVLRIQGAEQVWRMKFAVE